MNGLSRTERILRVILNKQGATLPEGEPMSRVEGLLLELKDAIQEGGTTDAQIIARVNTLETEVHDDYAKLSDLSTAVTAINSDIADCATDDDLSSAVSTLNTAISAKASSSDLSSAVSALNSSIADCVQDDDIVILTSNQYEALESKTALLYLIPEEE
jgi:hypothetical protein